MKKLTVLLLVLVWSVVPAFCCTSVIVSSRATADGRPIMLKHRDAGELNNRIERFVGPKYAFIGLVNSPVEGGEVWTGTNEAGFSIMNTASYNIKDDDVPSSAMDREGELMFKALGICVTVSDFEALLDTLPRPMGVEANFGVIDAHGGAAYYEVNNHSWVKFDVNDEPLGYRVVTNFSTSGREEDYQGYERYLTASEIMSEIYSDKDKWQNLSHKDFYESFSRSYRHKLLGVDYARDWDFLRSNTDFSGVVVDQDFIPRRITSASIVIEGVAPEENPLHTVMWTIIGYPACSVALPLLVGTDDCLPSYVKRTDESSNCLVCDLATSIKEENVFVYKISNGSHYLRLDTVLAGSDGRPALLDCCRAAENTINDYFSEIYNKWISGSLTDSEFFTLYKAQTQSYLSAYQTAFSAYLD